MPARVFNVIFQPASPLFLKTRGGVAKETEEIGGMDFGYPTALRYLSLHRGEKKLVTRGKMSLLLYRGGRRMRPLGNLFFPKITHGKNIEKVVEIFRLM